MSLTPWSLYPLVCWAPELCWAFRENIFALGWSRAPDCPAGSLVTTLTELSRRWRRIYTIFYALLRTCKLKTERNEKFVSVALVFCGT